MRKSCPGSYVVLDPRVHVAYTLAVYALLLLGWAIVRLCRVQPIRPQRIFHWIIATVTPIAVILFFVKIHAKDLGVRACTIWSYSHVATLLVDFVFFLRLLVEVLEGHLPEPMSSIVDCWLLVNTVWKLIKNVVIGEYQFLVFFRFLYPQTLQMYNMLFTRLFGVWGKDRLFQVGIATIGIFLFAGAIQTTEEWSQLLGIHPDAEGEATAWHTYWEYIYMGYVTVSTVGYGDMSPSTVAGQVVVVIAIVGYIVWYTDSVHGLYLAVKGVIFDIAGQLPPLPRERRLVVVGCLETDKMQQLLDELCARWETQVIVGIGRDESLSLRQVPGVFVIRSNLKRKFFKRCFPKHSTKPAEGPSYTLMILNQKGDGDEAEARGSDLHVLSLIQLVKTELSNLPVVAQVWRSESRVAVQNIDGWLRSTDQVVCHEELMAGLITQAIAAEGAASILATMISPPSTVPPAIHTCTDMMTRAHLWGQGLVLAVSDSVSMGEESFEQAALQYYLLERVVLLGYVQGKSGSAVQDRCYLLPTFLPPNVRRILLAPLDLVSPAGTVNTPVTHHSGNIHRSLPDSRSPNIRVKDKTVWVAGDGPAGGVARNALRRNLRVLSEDALDAPVDVAALLEPQEESGRALYNYYCAKAQLAEVSEWAPLVSNVVHGMQPGTGTMTAGCPHACTSFVNPCVVTSAVRLAYHFDFIFELWRFLVQECRLVEVEVKGYYCYGRMFQYLLTQQQMLAVGATVQVHSHSRAACTTALNLDPDDKGSLAVTNPDFDFCLHPGDKVVAFPLEEEPYSV